MTKLCFGTGWRVLPLLLLTVLAGGTIAGCNDSAKQASQPPADAQLTKQVLLPSNAPAGAGSAASLTPASAQPRTERPAAAAPTSPPQQKLNIPEGARWTIFCYAVKSPTHVHDAQAMRDQLNRSSGRADWYVIHGQDASNVYFGFYKAVEPGDRDNASAAQAAHADLAWVRERVSKDKSKPFARSLFVALDAPDPTAPPEWDLFNVDRTMNPQDAQRAFWSLQIMAFRAHPLRKEAAVQAVADLRAKGVEAYYYHGDGISSVTVGKWRYDAVKEQNRTDELKDVASGDPNTPLVVTPVPISEKLEARPIDGKRAVSVAPKLEVQDPSMLKMMGQFPTHAVNYEVGIVRDKDGKAYEDSSFLVEIPRAKGNGKFDAGGPAPVARDNNDGDWGRRRDSSMISPSSPRRSFGVNDGDADQGTPRRTP